MCTPWTVPRLVRWRVRDWASCFLACRFPLDDEPDTYRSPSPQLPIRNVVYDMKDDNRDKKTSKKLLGRNRVKKNRNRRLSLSPTQSRNNVSSENGSDHNNSSWPHFSDEDYIVFCFEEDGAFDVVKNGKTEAPSDQYPNRTSRSSSRPVNRKLKYGEDAETINTGVHKERPNEDGHEISSKNEGDIISIRKGEEEESVYLDSYESPSGSIRRNQVEETEKGGMVSIESSDSNQSDGSTGSFAFPVLGWEWMGSPVQMPNSEGLHLRKHKPRSLSFQCCRF